MNEDFLRYVINLTKEKKKRHPDNVTSLISNPLKESGILPTLNIKSYLKIGLNLNFGLKIKSRSQKYFELILTFFVLLIHLNLMHNQST